MEMIDETKMTEKPQTRKRSIAFSVSPEEYKFIRRTAADEFMSVSKFALKATLRLADETRNLRNQKHGKEAV